MSETFSPRLVECTKLRTGGTVIKFDECGRWPAGSYHFKAGALVDGRHACVVDVRQHYERFLDIPEAFRPVHGDDVAETPKAPSLSKPTTPPPEAPQPAAPAPAAATKDEDAFDAEKTLALGVNKIIAIAKNLSAEQLRELLEIESQRPDPRESLIKSLTGTLKARG
jgi:hypothetical protein